MKKPMIAEQICLLSQKIPLIVTKAQQTKLVEFLEQMEKWNKSYNLTAIKGIDRMLTHHIMDTLAIVPFIKGQQIADVGTGGGIPGIPLAVMFPEKKFTLIDSNGKKTRFIQQIVHQMSLKNVTIVCQRVEKVQVKMDTVISRAFASLNDMINGCMHLLNKQGLFQAMKGKIPQEELKRLPENIVLRSIKNINVPGLDAERHLINLARK